MRVTIPPTPQLLALLKQLPQKLRIKAIVNYLAAVLLMTRRLLIIYILQLPDINLRILLN